MADAGIDWFSNPRERRLWLWVLIAVAAIYSTLGIAPDVAGTLRRYGLLDAAFVAGMSLIALAAIVRTLKAQSQAVEIAVWLAIAAVFVLVLVRIEMPEERTHLIEYGAVALLIYEALRERAANRRPIAAPPIVAIVMTAIVGTIDEGLQHLLPNRTFDPRDILFNALAAILAVSGSAAISWARARAKE